MDTADHGRTTVTWVPRAMGGTNPHPGTEGAPTTGAPIIGGHHSGGGTTIPHVETEGEGIHPAITTVAMMTADPADTTTLDSNLTEGPGTTTAVNRSTTTTSHPITGGAGTDLGGAVGLQYMIVMATTSATSTKTPHLVGMTSLTATLASQEMTTDLATPVVA